MEIYNITYNSSTRTFSGMFKVENTPYYGTLYSQGNFVVQETIEHDGICYPGMTVSQKKTPLKVNFETFTALIGEARSELSGIARTHKEILVQAIDAALPTLPLEVVEKIYKLI